MTEVFIKSSNPKRQLYSNEKRILERLPEHPGLPKLIGVNDRKGRIILEQIPGLNLYEFREGQSRHFSKCLEIVTGVAAIVSVLHQHNFVHNDISSYNIMLRGRKRAPVLIDFQDSFRVGVESKLERSIRGTDFFLAPEKYQRRPFACLKSDIYSLGAVIFYAITGAKEPEPLLNSPSYPKALKQLVQQCLANSPRKRPTAKQVTEALQELS